MKLDLGQWPSGKLDPARRGGRAILRAEAVACRGQRLFGQYPESRRIYRGQMLANRGIIRGTPTPGLSWQPYLITIVARICEAVGYAADLSAWERSEEHRWLLVCNCFRLHGTRQYPVHCRTGLSRSFSRSWNCSSTPSLKSTTAPKTVGFAFTHDHSLTPPAASSYATSSMNTARGIREDAQCEYAEARENLVYKSATTPYGNTTHAIVHKGVERPRRCL